MSVDQFLLPSSLESDGDGNLSVNAQVPSLQDLTDLMSNLRSCFSSGPERLAGSLPAFFDAIRDIDFRGIGTVVLAAKTLVPAGAAVAQLLDGVRGHLNAVASSGIFGDPWAAAALRRDEVRNASVLRWFLDPGGDHACGAAILSGLLHVVSEALPKGFPSLPSAICSVAVEQSPDGDRTNRVDIQIDDPSFFLVVEVKIDAGEQPDQLARYCQIAAARSANARPWAVIFLTLDGRDPKSAGTWVGQVVPLSWKNVARLLRRTTRDASLISRFLATSFATHISNL